MNTCEYQPNKEEPKSKYFTSKFKANHSFDLRKVESEKIVYKYDGRIPIIVERENTCKVLPEINKNKFLVPSDLTMQQFHYVIRRRLELSASDAIYMFCNGAIPSCSATLESIYEKYKDPDGFLYIFYSGENTFGFEEPSVF
jgi:GABA(A) receptor-associated protein